MITILHRGGTAKRLQYYIGRGGSTETPKSDYVIYGWPLSQIKEGWENLWKGNKIKEENKEG